MKAPSTVAFAFFGAIAASGQEINISFAEWDRFSQVARVAYLAGVIDSLYSEPLEEETHRFHKCVQRNRRTLGELAEDIRLTAKQEEQKSSLKFKSVQEAIVH